MKMFVEYRKRDSKKDSKIPLISSESCSMNVMNSQMNDRLKNCK